MPIPWPKLLKEIKKHGLELDDTDPDGYCLLKSILKCLENDYGDTLTIDDCIPKIISHLCINHRLYTQWHHTKSRDFVTDKLVLDAVEFFRSGRFNVDVVDLLIQIAADVLDLHIFIYQETDNKVEVQSFHGEKCQTNDFINPYERVVRVLFTRGAISSGGNHYDTIWQRKKGRKARATIHKEFEEPDSDEDKSEIILNQPKMKRSRLSLKKHNPTQTSSAEQSTAMETDIFIDLTESDPDNNEISSPECIMVSPIKNEPNEDDDILIQSQLSASDTTYVSTDMMDVEPYSSPTYTPQFQNVKPTSTTSMSKSATSTSEDDPLCDLDTNFDEEVLLGNIARGKPFPTWYFANKIPIKADCLPMDVNGTKHFKIEATSLTWKNVTKDLRYFSMATTSHEGFFGEIRIGKCLGSYVCRNQ